MMIDGVGVSNYQEKSQEVDAIRKEAVEHILKKISVNDSYFYGEIVFYKGMDPSNPFEETISVRMILSLVNSQEFNIGHISNGKKMFLTPKRIEIRDKISYSDYELTNHANAIDFVMPYFYERISQELTQQLLKEGAHNFMMNVHSGYARPMSLKG